MVKVASLKNTSRKRRAKAAESGKLIRLDGLSQSHLPLSDKLLFLLERWRLSQRPAGKAAGFMLQCWHMFIRHRDNQAQKHLTH